MNMAILADVIRGVGTSPFGHAISSRSSLIGSGHDAVEIGSMLAQGLLATWDLDGVTYLTLTPLAAERLAVQLVDVGQLELPIWVDRSAVLGPIRIPSRSVDPKILEQVASPQAEVEPDETPPDPDARWDGRLTELWGMMVGRAG